MRISLDDSDTALPGLHDKDAKPSSMSNEMILKYLPTETETDELFHLWTCHTMLGISLGTLLSTNYRAKAPKPTREELERSENGIRVFDIDTPATMTRSRLVASHYYQFKLYYE